MKIENNESVLPLSLFKLFCALATFAISTAASASSRHRAQELAQTESSRTIPPCLKQNRMQLLISSSCFTPLKLLSQVVSFAPWCHLFAQREKLLILIEDLHWKCFLKLLLSQEQDANVYSVAEPQIHWPGLAHSLKCMFLLGARGEHKRLFSLDTKRASTCRPPDTWLQIDQEGQRRIIKGF